MAEGRVWRPGANGIEDKSTCTRLWVRLGHFFKSVFETLAATLTCFLLLVEWIGNG